jgi:hypothetical protein
LFYCDKNTTLHYTTLKTRVYTKTWRYKKYSYTEVRIYTKTQVSALKRRWGNLILVYVSTNRYYVYETGIELCLFSQQWLTTKYRVTNTIFTNNCLVTSVTSALVQSENNNNKKEIRWTKRRDYFMALNNEVLVRFIQVVVHVDTFRLCLWTSATNGHFVYPSDDIWVRKATVEWYWQGKIEELREKPVPPHRPTQILHWLTRARTRASTVKGRRLTARAMAGQFI